MANTKSAIKYIRKTETRSLRNHQVKTRLKTFDKKVAAASAAEPWKEEELYQLMRRAAPFEGLSREPFDEVVELGSEGTEPGRGRRVAYVHRYPIGAQLRARRPARLAPPAKCHSPG